jgi:tetratricopeptide (TPR) repeat protein
MGLTRQEQTLLVICLILVGIGGVVARHLSGELQPAQDYTAAELRQMNESALGALFGEFRVSVADILWLKTDEYIHKGIEYRQPHAHELEEAGHEEELHAHPEQHAQPTSDTYTVEHAMGYGHAHEHVVSVIPRKESDFRGILGDIEREVKPYSPTHLEHTGFEEVIPWYRLLTYINPHHTRGYVVGSYVIATYAKAPEQALEFLKEGERNNPKSPEIQEALGRLYFYKLHRADEATPYFQKAISLLKSKSHLTEDEEDVLLNAYRGLAHIYGDKKDRVKLAAVLDEAWQRFPGDISLKHSRQTLEQLSREGS